MMKSQQMIKKSMAVYVSDATTKSTDGVEEDAKTDIVQTVTGTFQEQQSVIDKYMETHEVQSIADRSQVDVRIIEKWHWRLMDIYGAYVIDVYFKRNKAGQVIRNTTFDWRTERWGQLNSRGQLIERLKHTPKWKNQK